MNNLKQILQLSNAKGELEFARQEGSINFFGANVCSRWEDKALKKIKKLEKKITEGKVD